MNAFIELSLICREAWAGFGWWFIVLRGGVPIERLITLVRTRNEMKKPQFHAELTLHGILKGMNVKFSCLKVERAGRAPTATEMTKCLGLFIEEFFI